jgi:hypothetical protein
MKYLKKPPLKCWFLKPANKRRGLFCGAKQFQLKKDRDFRRGLFQLGNPLLKTLYNDVAFAPSVEQESMSAFDLHVILKGLVSRQFLS